MQTSMASSNHLSDVRSTLDIDPSGDVLLQVGDQDERKNLLVSSKVLSIASPVFAAMFGPNFKEGTSLSSTVASKISLPEDDPASMLLLCNCLHFRSGQIPVDLEYPDLRSFAVLCDKYGCTNAVSAWTELWLRKWENESCIDGFEVLLLVVYALDSPIAFNKISKRAILHQVGPFDTGSDVEGLDMAPHDLIATLESKRAIAKIELLLSIEDLASPALEEHEIGEAFSCPFRASSTHSYFRELKNCSLWPLSAILYDANLTDIFHRTSSFKETNVKLQSTNSKITSCKCDLCGTRLRLQMQRLAETHLSKVSGLCLDCVKSEYTGLDLTCRVIHPAEL